MVPSITKKQGNGMVRIVQNNTIVKQFMTAALSFSFYYVAQSTDQSFKIYFKNQRYHHCTLYNLSLDTLKN